MPKKRAKKKPAKAPRRAPVAPPSAKGASAQTAEEQAFVASLVRHRQAVAVAPGQKLPPGTTHELTTDAHGQPKVVRKRFSAI